MNDLIMAAVECAPTEEMTWPLAVVLIAGFALFGLTIWLGLR